MSERLFTFIILITFLCPAAAVSAQDTTGKAQVMMQQQGFHKLCHLDGGITAWKGDVEKTEEP